MEWANSLVPNYRSNSEDHKERSSGGLLCADRSLGFLAGSGGLAGTRLPRSLETRVVFFRLFGISHGERGNCVVEHVRFSHIASHQGRVARARMRSRKRAAAKICIRTERL